jgi:hypothetical protein
MLALRFFTSSGDYVRIGTSLVKASLVAVALSAPLTVQAQLSESFNDISTLAASGWVQKNNSQPLGQSNWFQGNTAVFAANSGAADAYIGANFINAGSATDGVLSNWLITPEQTLVNGGKFSFFTRGAQDGFADRLELRMSLAGASSNVGATATSIGDFSSLLLTINPALSTTGYPGEWTKYTVTLSGIAAPTAGRFALRYFVTDTENNGDYIGIDDVNYTASVVPEPQTVVLTGIGMALLAFARRRRRV